MGDFQSGCGTQGNMQLSLYDSGDWWKNDDKDTTALVYHWMNHGQLSRLIDELDQLVILATERNFSQLDKDWLASEKCFGPANNGYANLNFFTRGWTWFVAFFKLVTHERVIFYWTNYFIYGIIGKTAAQDLLVQRPRNSFILRFSESRPGCLVVDYLDGLCMSTLIELSNNSKFIISERVDGREKNAEFDQLNLLINYFSPLQNILRPDGSLEPKDRIQRAIAQASQQDISLPRYQSVTNDRWPSAHNRNDMPS